MVKQAPQHVTQALKVFDDWELFNSESRWQVVTRGDSVCIALIDVAVSDWPHVIDLELNVETKTLYLLHIVLKWDLRNKGYGSQLYELIVEFAKRCGCREVRQTPSGWAHHGEERRHWLERRGWTTEGVEAVIYLKNAVVPCGAD